ncbi:MAG: glycoside hydrolase family 30 beta sandwich domain-containing protein [Bacteroidales bacterium]
MKALVPLLFATLALAGCQKQTIEWVTTTPDASWVLREALQPAQSEEAAVTIDLDLEMQVMEGFGSCFNELGWTSLGWLSEADREAVLEELFRPGVGGNFTICRMPVAANDFARNWYSYNETDGDFAMEHFSIDNDQETLIPFIRGAKKHNPDLRIWASPWSPPTWMKHNKHYASRSSERMMEMIRRMAPPPEQTGEETGESPMAARFRTMLDPRYQNDLPPDREGFEGTDMFIQEDAYLEAYALYFTRFIEAYRAEGIDLFAVMPQNEFNSAQNFPSCCWTAAGLSRFIGQYLGPAMDELGVDLYFGTMERPAEALVDTILTDPSSGPYIKGVGFQWAGKDALPGLHKRHPELAMWQTEQECGDGRNDWAGAMHSWELMKHYLNHGVSVYEYWNTSLEEGGISRWGWAQNSLVVVDAASKTYRYSYEYYILKHASHYVLPGAVKLGTEGEDADVLAFRNPDGSVVVLIANQGTEAKQVAIRIGDLTVTPELAPQSLNTLQFRLNQ